MSVKHLEVVRQLDLWAVMHNGETLATFPTEAEAERSAAAIARTQPPGDTAEVVVVEDEDVGADIGLQEPGAPMSTFG